MPRHKHLPDSLELLLDTMCNTFGGIVFIAITLIVISQLVSDKLLKATPEEIDRKRLEQIRQRVKTLETEVTEKKRLLGKRHFTEKPADRQRQHEVEKLQSLTNDFLQQEQESKSLMLQHQANRTYIARLERDCQQSKEHATQARREAEKELSALQKLIRMLQTTIDRLLVKTANTPKPKLRFSIEKITTLSPFWVFMKQGQIYRYSGQGTAYDDVTAYRLDDELHFSFLRGHTLGQDYERQLEQLFSGVDRQLRFISICADGNSFDSLLKTRRFMRKKNIKTQWFISNKFVLYLSDDVTHTASD